MRDITLALDRIGAYALMLGRVGENRATRVTIDLSGILASYPDALGAITVKQPNGREYPAVVTQVDGMLTWVVTSADIGDKPGTGAAQITVRSADGTIIKTAIAVTRVAESLGSPQTLAPDPVKGWVANAEEILADVERSGTAAQTIADEVKRKLDAGELTGAPGRDGVDGRPGKDAPQEAVLYTAQTLDDAQKAQARQNIGAADEATVDQLKSDKVNKDGTNEVTAENCEFIRKSPQLFDKNKAADNTVWSAPNITKTKENSVAILMAEPNKIYKINIKQNRNRNYLRVQLFSNNLLVADMYDNKIEAQYISLKDGVLTLTIQNRYGAYSVTSAGITLVKNGLEFDGVTGTFDLIKEKLIVTYADDWNGKYHTFGDDKVKDQYLPPIPQVPTKTSELENDSGFLTASDISIQNNKRIMCRGDSLTAGAGAGGSQYKYTSVLGNLIKSDTIVSYFAVGGESAEKIAARMGAIPIILNPFTLPSDTSRVEVTVKNWCGKNLDFYGDAGINPCYVNNVECTFEFDSGKRYIKRNASGESKTFDRPVELITRDYREFRNCIAVIWIGTNNSQDSAEFIIEMQKLMVKNLQTDRFIVIGLTCQNDQYRNDVAEVNKKMAEEWGSRFLNIYDYILEYGLLDENLTPTQADSAAIAKGEMPPSLIYKDDGYNVHFNRYGYDIVGKQLYKKGVDLGYWE